MKDFIRGRHTSGAVILVAATCSDTRFLHNDLPRGVYRDCIALRILRLRGEGYFLRREPYVPLKQSEMVAEVILLFVPYEARFERRCAHLVRFEATTAVLLVRVEACG